MLSFMMADSSFDGEDDLILLAAVALSLDLVTTKANKRRRHSNRGVRHFVFVLFFYFFGVS